MKHSALLITIIIFSSTLKLFGQVPFTTLVKEPRFIEKKENIDNKEKFEAVTDTSVIKALINKDNPALLQNKEIKESTKNDIDFFKNNGLTLNLIDKGENRVSVNSQVLHYKLYVANPNEKNKYRKNRYNIPLMIITKLSSSYDSTSAASSIDVLDYEAAPITLRIMPSIKKSFKTYNDVFYFGLYTDARGLNLYNPEKDNYTTDFIGSGGIGFTYQGDGQAGTYNARGEYEPGKYSISVILQGAYGKKETLSRLFKTNDEYVTSIQSYFLFQVSEKSHLNIKIGYQHFFQETVAGTKNNFSLTLGI